MARHLLAVVGLAGFVALSTACSAGGEGAPAAQDAPEVNTIRDADIQARIEAAAEGAIFVSEADAPFTFVQANGPAESTLDAALVRELFASFVDADEGADKPLSSLVSMSESWDEWESDYAASECTEDTFPGPEECAAVRKMNEAIEKDLKDVKVFYFGAQGTEGAVDGTGVSVFILGRTPSGSYAGVRTLAIWT